MFESILVANRGEIACRVFRSARERGYECIAVYSDADANALHVKQADRAVHIGPSQSSKSYLNISRIIECALRSGAQAIHPGYGFLSENAEFAKACAAVGLVFIGPPADAIEIMGSKRLSKLKMQAAGVPCVPGYSGADQSIETLMREARLIGAPLMIKASAGGGGRGLRLVRDFSSLEENLTQATNEGKSVFGSGELILEKAIQNPRHIEIQIFADSHGNVIHLGERDCSVQRRHQKVIEEAPGPSVSPETREMMGKAAVDAAKAIGYTSAGTVEFLLEENGGFYFMEMNTRLQVEHPVTEEITGIDLVGLQLDVSAGKSLPITQKTVRTNGHAMEVRLYAEDPAQDFLPQTGEVLEWNPQDLGVRVDAAIERGSEISSFYDPMVAKLIAHGSDREEARRKLLRALDRAALHGIKHNGAFLSSILRHPDFIDGHATTAFLEDHKLASIEREPEPELIALAAHLLSGQISKECWTSAAASARPMKISVEGKDPVTLKVTQTAITLNNDSFTVKVVSTSRGSDLVFEINGLRRKAVATVAADGVLWLTCEGQTYQFVECTLSQRKVTEDIGGDVIVAPMPGEVIELRAKEGDVVSKGDVLLILEAMKMQHELIAPRDGTVCLLGAKMGAQVSSRDVLVTLETESA
ncbi:ATP-binding protein [Flexibacterium corallicola]|uniref:ATP-binding protein n=1 Tax=Flexibacterium corallicola TaxID=3037259 RepID=UPI00286F4E6B|nr:biotin carboxylase N-terminal domain-containing protein [Pseudovibrio sp. M1P-2-3]